MCLKEPANFKVRKEDGYYVGYKLFEYRGKNIFNTYQAQEKPRTTDKWLTAYGFKTGVINFSIYDGIYRPGFHIYKHLKSAIERMWWNYSVVMKVYADEITQKGIDRESQTFVSKYMYIPSDTLRWSHDPIPGTILSILVRR